MKEQDEPRLDETQPSAAGTRPRAAGADGAYQKWLGLTLAEPSSLEAWIGRANAAVDMQEKIGSLSHALELDPASIRARQTLHACMTELLKRDSRLEYQGETRSVYRLRTPQQYEFSHPKDRAPSELPAAGGQGVRRIYGWLKWALIGLIPAGLGTLLFAPMTMLGAVLLLQRPLAEGDRRRMWLAILLGAVLWLLALIPMIILALHII
jgi:hypothetical protein